MSYITLYALLTVIAGTLFLASFSSRGDYLRATRKAAIWLACGLVVGLGWPYILPVAAVGAIYLTWHRRNRSDKP